MLPIGTQIYLIGFCVPIKGTQQGKINDLQKPCLPRFGTHLYNHTSMKNITDMSKANDPEKRIDEQRYWARSVRGHVQRYIPKTTQII